MPEDDAAERFWRLLRDLYLAAGKPTLQRLVHLGLEQRPAVTVSHSTINGWLNAKAVPTGRKNERYLTAMILFLQAQARADTGYQRLPPGEWGRLLRAAQRQRSAGQQTGRPRRARPPRAGAVPPGHPVRVTDGLSRGPLVGRDRELALLGQLVRGIAAGQGGTVLVEGEPGVGKSALVQVALADVESQGGQVFWGTGSELDQALPLQPLLDALRVREPSGNPRRATIARYLRGEVGPERGADGPALLAEQLLALVTEESAARATILVVDDLQWADRASIRLLARLAGSARQLPLLLVIMLRPVPHRGDLPALLRAARDPVRLPLAGLDRVAATELIGALAGGQPDAGLLELAADAAGNPLYLTELVAALRRSSRVSLADGIAALTPGPAPRSLVAAITDRLGFISGSARAVLRSASLLGPEFSVTDLAVVTRQGVTELATVLQEACAAGVLAESGRRLKFRHPLIHAALYQELPAPVRAAWHGEAGRALAAAGAPADRVARQLLGAAGEAGAPAEPMDAWMLSWLDGAAELLVALAPQVAATLLRRAVTAGLLSPAQRGRLAAHLADARYRIGERAAAAELARRELDRTTDADVLVSLHWTLAQCRIGDGASAESLAGVERALATPGLAARHRGRLLVLAARAHNSSGAPENALRVAEAALAAAEEAGDTWATAWALQVIAGAAAVQGRLADALRSTDRALAVVGDDRALADLRLLLQVNKMAALGNLDRFDEAQQLAEEVRQIAVQAGTMIRLAQVHFVLTQLFYEVGRWDEALAEMARVPPGMKEPAMVCADLGIAAVISFLRDDVDAARGHLAAAVPYAARIDRRLVPPLVLARSLDHELAGDLPAAQSVLTRWLDGGTEEVPQLQEIMPDAARVAARAGDQGVARALAAQSAALATADATPTAHGTALYCRGLLDGDAPALLAAAERYQQAGRPLQRARALGAAGRALTGAGDAAAARQTQVAAAAVYRQLGIQPACC